MPASASAREWEAASPSPEAGRMKGHSVTWAGLGWAAEGHGYRGGEVTRLAVCREADSEQ